MAGWLRQVTQPPFIAGPLGGIAPATVTGLRLRIYHENYISFVLLNLDTNLIKFLPTVTTFCRLSGLSHLDNFAI
jgi:hypothetical protein